MSSEISRIVLVMQAMSTLSAETRAEMMCRRLHSFIAESLKLVCELRMRALVLWRLRRNTLVSNAQQDGTR